MPGEEFYTANKTRRRGGFSLPARLCRRARCGVTLVELMISMLILTIVCLAWLEIVGIQSARKEARRREAVERLSGMMDAFLYIYKSSVSTGSYQCNLTPGLSRLSFTKDSNTNVVHSVFDGLVSPIGYQLRVVTTKDLPNQQSLGTRWGSSKKWLIGNLYDRNGAVREVGKPFFTLSVCTGQ